MSILDKYIIRFFLSFFTLSLFICLFIILIIPFVEELDSIIANRVPISVMMTYLLYSVPTVFVEIIPMVVLLAMLLALISLNRHQELLAMLSNGIGLYRLTVFLLIVVLGIATFTWLIQENVVPATVFQAKMIKTNQIDRKPTTSFLQEEQMWIRSDPHLIYSVGLVSRTGTRLFQVTILELSADEQRVLRRLDINELQWSKNKAWVAVTGLERRFDEAGWLMRELPLTNLPIAFSVRPQDLQRFSRQPEELNTEQLKQYIELVRRSGLDVKDYLTDYYLKYVHFVAPIILALLGIAYGATLAPRTATKGFAQAILLAILFYLVQFFVRNLGRAGVLPAIMSAWLVPLAFTGWSLWRIHRNIYG